MKNNFMAYILAGLLVLLAGTVAAGDWAEDFGRLCGATETAESLSVDELKALIAECDTLREVIEKEAGKQKKVYLFRLEKCRNFFSYLVTLKETKQKE